MGIIRHGVPPPRPRHAKRWHALNLRSLRGLIAACVFGLGVFGTAAQSPPPDPSAAQAANLYRLVKRFDFDERALGNYEETPMFWRRLSGPGLPAYNHGRFDLGTGDPQPPSFHMSITGGGSVCYEYRQRDLAAVAGSDYVITARVRAVGLKSSRAFVAAFFVDRFDEELPGTRRVTGLVASTRRDPEPWQSIRVDLPGDHPEAYALRLQLWLLQSHVWQDVNPADPDPILAQDVRADVWIDDLSVLRLPRTRLGFTNPGCVVEEGTSQSFIIEMNNPTATAMSARLYITDHAGHVVHEQPVELASQMTPAAAGGHQDAGAGHATERATAAHGTGHATSARDAPGHAAPAAHDSAATNTTGAGSMLCPVPSLPAGIYRAVLSLQAGGETLLERELTFVVLAALESSTLVPDVGVALAAWRGGERAALRELLRAMGCGAVKIGIPLIDPEAPNGNQQDLGELAELLRDLAERRVDTAAVLLAPTPVGAHEPQSLRTLIQTHPSWANLLRPILARCGGLLSTWQTGDERIELRGGDWSDDEVEALRRAIRQFVTLPRLVRPYSIVDPGGSGVVGHGGPDARSIRVPASIPVPALETQLAEIRASDGTWLQLEFDEARGLSREQRLADLARRVIQAKASPAQRVYVPAPFEWAGDGAHSSWRPTEAYVVLRTLFHLLGGARFVGRLDPAPDASGLLFEGQRGGGVYALWTWRVTGDRQPVSIHLGAQARAFDLWGRPVELLRAGERVTLTAEEAPLLVTGVDVALARLAASVRLAPDHVEAQGGEPPVLYLTNPYPARLAGEIVLTAPDDWTVAPGAVPFVLEAGESLEQRLTLTLPPRQWAARRELGVTVRLHSPKSAVLDFQLPVSVKLSGVDISARVFWQDADLIVEHSVHNHTAAPVSFSGYCDAPGRAQKLTAFLDVAPNERCTQRYVYGRAADLRGRTLLLGVREIRGDRRLAELVDVPD